GTGSTSISKRCRKATKRSVVFGHCWNLTQRRVARGRIVQLIIEDGDMQSGNRTWPQFQTSLKYRESLDVFLPAHVQTPQLNQIFLSEVVALAAEIIGHRLCGSSQIAMSRMAAPRIPFIRTRRVVIHILDNKLL